MQVSFNGKFFGSSATGVQRVALELIRATDAGLAEGRFDYGVAPEVICPRDAAAPPALIRLAERRSGLFTWQPWEQFDLPRLARGRLLVNLCNLAPLAGARQVTMIHDAQVYLSPSSYSRAFRTWYQFALPRIGAVSRRILTVSAYSRDMLEKYGVAPRDKVDVIHNGVDHMAAVAADPAAVERLGLSGRPYVLTIASTQTHKNIGVLLDAFRRPELAGVALVLAGSTSAADLLAAGTTPPPGAIFTGRVSDGALRGLLEAALAYACPSTTEGFGLPPLEAMYVGCPAVVAPCGALPEVCGDAALYADANDPAMWARAFAALAEEGAARAARVARGRSHAAGFTWARAAQQLADVVALERAAG